MSKTDRSSPVRSGEELPIEPLFDFLSTHLPQLSGTPVVEQFPAGFSNLTYLLRFGDRELVLGLLKIAVIVQQIYFRYQKGLTRDPRFAQLGGLVSACGDLAQRAIERRRIDSLAADFRG